MRILIVDDEVIIRNGLSTVIDWAGLGFELLTPAASAEEALARMPAERPHIVLTDIRMTGKDGLALASEVRRELPETEVLILTGYDEFSYAQQALREGVSDYLLKTSRPEEIIRAAMQAKQRIQSRWEAKRQDRQKQAVYRDSLLEQLLAGDELDEAAFAQVPRLLPKLGGERSAALQVLIVAASGWEGREGYPSLLLFAAENMLRELLPCETLRRKDHLVAAFARETGAGCAEGLRQARTALARIGRELKCATFAAAGGCADELGGLARSHAEAAQAFAYRWLMPGEALIRFEDVQNRKGGRSVCSSDEEAELVAVLRGGSVIELRQWTDKAIASQLADPETTPTSLRAYSGSVVLTCRRWLDRVMESLGEPEAALAAPDDEENESDESPAESMFRQLRAILELYREHASGERVSYVKRAIAYIGDHLDKNLTLQQVAKHVHLNPNHFSEVFKRETGLTYIDYVTRERIRRAMELLDRTPAKISEIAGSVGYEDVKYFSQLFRKITGQTPSEYRSRN